MNDQAIGLRKKRANFDANSRGYPDVDSVVLAVVLRSKTDLIEVYALIKKTLHNGKSVRLSFPQNRGGALNQFDLHLLKTLQEVGRFRVNVDKNIDIFI